MEKSQNDSHLSRLQTEIKKDRIKKNTCEREGGKGIKCISGSIEGSIQTDTTDITKSCQQVIFGDSNISTYFYVFLFNRGTSDKIILHTKSRFTQQQFNKGRLPNFSMVAKLYQMHLCEIKIKFKM